MKILKWTELNSGGVQLEIEMTTEEQRFFIEYAIIDILTKKMELDAKEGGGLKDEKGKEVVWPSV